jgi:hypothetical protein
MVINHDQKVKFPQPYISDQNDYGVQYLDVVFVARQLQISESAYISSSEHSFLIVIDFCLILQRDVTLHH